MSLARRRLRMHRRRRRRRARPPAAAAGLPRQRDRGGAARADEGRHAPGRERRLRVPDRHRHRRRRSRLRAQDHGARRRLLFQKVFFGPAAGDDSKRIGSFLRSVASDPAKRLKLQVVAETAPIPWALLYMGDASAGATLDWDLFLGMRHVIEEIPLQTNMTVIDSAIAQRPAPGGQRQRQQRHRRPARRHLRRRHQRLLGRGADGEKARRRRPRGRRAPTSCAPSPTRRPTTRSSTSTATRSRPALSDPGGPDASALVLTDARITLADLNLDAPTTTLLRGKPLVFINACESAELSPAFYDGFVPYFMAKGARGVVGTQCKTPALFAAEWAKRFFERFLDGAALGEAFLALRREFLDAARQPARPALCRPLRRRHEDRAGARLGPANAARMAP